MTKSEFFKMLDNALEFHKADNYTAADIEVLEFHEDPANLAQWRKDDPAYPWIAHSSGYQLGKCWLTSVISHRTAEAAAKQCKIFERWIAEYKTR